MRRPLHDPESRAAAYVNGNLRPKAGRRFEQHLLTCDECWREVELEREGRRIAERARELAPASLRDQVRGLVTVSAGVRDRRRPGRLSLVTAGIAAVILVTSLSLLVIRSSGGRQPAEISAAEAAFRSGPVIEGPASSPAPDLGAMGLQVETTGRMRLAGMPVDSFTFRDASGAALMLFVARAPFPVASGAVQRGPGMGSGWSARMDGMSMVCGSSPVNFLLVGRNQQRLEELRGPLATALTWSS
jgi:hypothetical protein